MKIKHPWPPYKPQVPVSDKMCNTCPFHPSGEGHGANHPDLQSGGEILTKIEMGIAFSCHKTVIFDRRTKKDRRGDPLPGQAHFLHCLGAVLYKQGKIHSPGTTPDKQEDPCSQ